MEELRLFKGLLRSDSDPLTEQELFKIKNKLSQAELEYILLRNSIGQNPLGEIKFPNGTIKTIKK